MKHDAAAWANARLSRLIACLRADHVTTRYGAVADLVRAVDERIDPAAREIFIRLTDLLRKHLTREEHVVFPLIDLMEEASLEHCRLPPPLDRGLSAVIGQLTREHEEICRLLDALKRCAGVGPCAADLDRALRECMQLEDAVLYPRAIALEKKLYGVGDELLALSS